MRERELKAEETAGRDVARGGRDWVARAQGEKVGERERAGHSVGPFPPWNAPHTECAEFPRVSPAPNYP